MDNITVFITVYMFLTFSFFPVCIHLCTNVFVHSHTEKDETIFLDCTLNADIFVLANILNCPLKTEI